MIMIHTRDWRAFTTISHHVKTAENGTEKENLNYWRYEWYFANLVLFQKLETIVLVTEDNFEAWEFTKNLRPVLGKILVLFPLPKKCAAFYLKLCILNFPALGHFSAVRVSWL